ncbi:hypothetical protein AXK58_21105 [Tsukamurella tyrosinosolvens]|nr:hypothetical protein AXK58_21105 [Tsukamurella tyrosinosolvens]
MLLAASPAQADPAGACSAPVVDATHDKVLDSASVTTRVLDLRGATGADVYVRAFQNTPGGSAAVWWQDAYRECPSWLGADGKTPKPNLLVVQFGMDRTNAIQYGSSFHRLDPWVDRVRADMGVHLRRSDFTGAVTSTLVALDEALKPAPDATEGSGSAPLVSAPASDVSTMAGGRAMLRFAIGIIALAIFIFAAFQSFHVLQTRSRRKEEAREARRRLDAAIRSFSAARSDATTAARTSGVEDAKVRATAAAAEAEGTVDLGAFTELLSRRDELRRKVDRPAGILDDGTEDKVLDRVAALTRLIEQLRSVDREAVALADAAEAKIALCTPERKRADLEAEARLLDQQAATSEVPGIDLSHTGATLRAKRDEVLASADLIGAGNVPPRADVDAALSEAAQLRASAADEVARAGHVISELNYVRDRAARIVEQYSRPVPGVSAEAAERAVVAAFEVTRKTDVTVSAIPAEGADLDALGSQVDDLRRAARAATEEVDRQVATHQAEGRRRAEEERRRRLARRSSSSSYGTSYGSDYASGLATGAILGSLGSSNSSSSSSFGGGGYSGGGGDFGGGSSGSW